MLQQQGTTRIPAYVKLREERRWIPNGKDSVRDADDAGEWQPYVYAGDAELDLILTRAAGNPEKALEGWYQAAKEKLRKKIGVYLIPGPLQTILRLPVRQIYLRNGSIFRIEKDGFVTVRLRKP